MRKLSVIRKSHLASHLRQTLIFKQQNLLTYAFSLVCHGHCDTATQWLEQEQSPGVNQTLMKLLFTENNFFLILAIIIP